MTTTTAAAGLRTSALRAAQVLASVGAVLLVADTITVTVLNRSFDPVDSVLFLTGLACMLGTAVALAVHVSRRRHGATRLALAVGVFLGVVLVLGGISSVFDQLGRHVFSPSNKGLHGEWSFFSIGVCLALLAWQLPRYARRSGGRS